MGERIKLDEIDAQNDFLRGFGIAFMVGMIAWACSIWFSPWESAGLLKRVALVNIIWVGRDGRRECALLLCRADFVRGSHAGDLCAGMVEAAG